MKFLDACVLVIAGEEAGVAGHPDEASGSNHARHHRDLKSIPESFMSNTRFRRSYNLVPIEIALKIANKIKVHERFSTYIVVPMWPEGNPTGAPTQRILYWQNKTMQMMYATVWASAWCLSKCRAQVKVARNLWWHRSRSSSRRGGDIMCKEAPDASSLGAMT